MSALVSIVVPTHNEQGNIQILCDRIAKVFSNLANYDWEIIFVDDSTDATPLIITDLVNKNPRIKLIRLVRSFGQAPAIAAGLRRAKGQAVILMDADLQDPPEAIPSLLEKWREGYKLVYVQRASQSNSYLYKFLAKSFYRILAAISDIKIPIDTGEFRLIDQTLVSYMNSLTERSRFIRGHTVWPGYPSVKVQIERGERLSGATNYNLAKSFAVAIDGFVSFSIVPLRLATFLGFTGALLAICLSIVYLILWIVDRSLFGAGWMSLFLAIAFMGSLNLICIGIVGEYVGRVFMEQQKRPVFMVDYELGFESSDG